MNHARNSSAPSPSRIDLASLDVHRGRGWSTHRDPARDYDDYAASLVWDHELCKACNEHVHTDHVIRGVCDDCRHDKFKCDWCSEWKPLETGWLRIDTSTVACQSCLVEWQKESPEIAGTIPGLDSHTQQERTKAS